MIYCYYDKNGVLREIINNESTRQGASESRAIIRVYFELHKEITDMTALYKTGDYTTATQRYSAGIIETIVPYNNKINYKYFKDNTPYTFFEFEIPSDILEKGANDFSTNVSCTFTPYYNNEEWDKLGLLTFNLQASVLNIDDTLTTSQMDYLLAEISKFEFIKNNGVYGTTDTSIVDGANAYSVHTNGCFVLQYVEATSQSVPAENIAGIRFYRVVNNKYSLLYSSVEETDILYKLEQSDITQNYQITTLLNDVARLKEVFLDFATKEELSRVAFSGDYNDLSNKPNIPTQLSELTNNEGFITNAVSDLINYYKKTETFTKDEITAKLNAIKTIKFEIYASLDDIATPQTNVIYLVGTESPYDEYAYIESVGFELIGSSDIDLSNYVQTNGTLNTDYVVLGNGDKNIKNSTYKIETSSLNNTGIPTTNLVQTEIRKYHDIITINGDSGTILNTIDTAYRLIVDENLLVYRRIKNDNNAPIYYSQQVIDKEHIRDYYLVFSGNNYTRSYVENVSHNEFDSLVANTPTEITYNKETKVAQLTHDGQPIGDGVIIDLDGFTPYFDGSGLVLSDLESAEIDLSTKQDKLVSGTNIKTINNQSILGSGNITIEGGGGSGGGSENDICELVLDYNNITDEQVIRLLIILPTIIDACSSTVKLAAFLGDTAREQEYITVDFSINDLPSDFLNKFNNAKYFKLALMAEGEKFNIATLPLRSKSIDNNIEQSTGEFSSFGINTTVILSVGSTTYIHSGAAEIYLISNELKIGMYAKSSEIANVS